MKGELQLYYDAEGDYLEIQLGGYEDGTYNNLGEGIFERVDKKTQKTTGIAVHGFKKRTEGNKDLKLALPVNVEFS